MIENEQNKKTIFVRLGLSLMVLCGAILIAGVLSYLKKPPRRKPASEMVKVLYAEPVKLQDVKIKLNGFGTVEPIREVTLSSQLSGRIIMKSVDLKAGQLIAKGQVVAKIDTMDYEIALQQTKSEVARLVAEIAQLKQSINDWEDEFEKDKEILALCVSDYKRQVILQRKKATAKKNVETAQRLVVNQRKALLSTQNTINQKVLQVKTLEASLKGAMAKEHQAKVNIERSIIRSPFKGRLKKLYIDNGELVSPGSKICDIADDTKLEIPVSLDAREVAQAMGMIKHNITRDYLNWFEAPEDRKVTIRWAEKADLCIWEGYIDRIKDFCPETRTVCFIVRPVKFLRGKSGFFPLLSGMFCKVEFSGITLKNAISVSWQAVQLDGDAYVINKEGRLEERKIEVFPVKSEKAIICGGLKNGDMMVMQRLPRGLINGMKVLAINPKTSQPYNKPKKPAENKKGKKGSKGKRPGNGYKK